MKIACNWVASGAAARRNTADHRRRDWAVASDDVAGTAYWSGGAAYMARTTGSRKHSCYFYKAVSAASVSSRRLNPGVKAPNMIENAHDAGFAVRRHRHRVESMLVKARNSPTLLTTSSGAGR